MSTEIEQRVVEMQFDNKQFERNVSTTMSSLDKLKQGLNLTGAAKGLESVGTAAKGINLSGLSGAAETVSLKFNAMYSAVDQIFRNLVTRAQFAGERIASAFTIEPIKAGFAEYETQINSVQTILANTKSKGTTIDDVNGALDELNTYADKTIYNFTEMTRNIGTFTAAGVDLDKSVTSIKGIANLAAVSGSTSQQASTAMYQLSQALAAGKVQLMDWNSVVNAGMGGQVFQDALKRTAKNMGTDVDKLIKKYGSFRESLTQGEWLTADVLTETLTQLSGAYTEADLLAKGYTKEQAKEILDLAQTAGDAATKVKTFTQLWDTLKEAAQSGWTQTWELLIGDFEEAKEFMTSLSDMFGEWINNSSEKRNKLLGSALGDKMLGVSAKQMDALKRKAEQTGVPVEKLIENLNVPTGREMLIDSLKNSIEALVSVVKPIKDAFGEIFPAPTAQQVYNAIKSFKEFTDKLILSEESSAKLKTTFKGLFAVVDIGWTFVKKLAGGIVDLFRNFTGLGGGILDATSSIGDWLMNLRDTVKETDIFGAAIDKVVGFVSKIINEVKKFATTASGVFNGSRYEGFLGFFRGLWDIIKKIGSRVGEIFAPLGKAVSDLFGNVNFADVLNDGIFAGVLVGIYKFVDNLNGPLGSLKDIFDGIGGEDGIIGGIKETLDSVKGCLEAYQNQLNAEALKKIATAIAILAGAIFVISSIDETKLDQSLGAITILFAELLGSLAIFTKINSGSKGLVKSVAAINGIASALLILSIGMKIMSTMSWGEIAVGIVGTVAGLGALVGAVNLLPEKNVLKASKAIGKLATALVILAAGMKIMASMSWQEMGVAITGVVAGLGALVAAVNLLPKDAGLRSVGMIGLATAMVILGSALKIMSTMSWDELGRGLAAMGGSLVAIVGAINLMPKDAALRSLGMVGLATAMVILGAALKSMGGMTWAEIVRGLGAMCGVLLELAIALNVMNGAIAGAGALIIAAGALAIIAPVMKTLGGLSWAEIAKGLVALAGAFAVVGIAGLLLAPLVPTLLGLAGAFALFSLSMVGIGIGLGLISAGITALSVSLSAGVTAIVAGISAIIGGIIGLIPNIVTGLGDAIIALCDVVIEVAPQLAETLLVVVSEVLAALATYTPQIVDSLLQFLIGVLDALAANLPQLIASAVNLIGAFFQGIVDALSGMDTTSLIKTIAGVGLLAGLMFALSALTPIIPSAMAGVLGMGVLIAEMALVLAAVGALAQIPGLSWLIGEGGDLLQQIGTAIGQFVGGLIGGIAEGATSTLPQVGTNLSDFMTNLQPFIEGMKGLDSTLLDNAKALANTILTLTAADLLSGIASFFKGGTSLADFGTEIAAFGTAMKDYSAEVEGINSDAITASVNAGSKLVKMAGDIPSDGLFGTDGIDDFGKNLVKFGKKMKEYGEEVADINPTAIVASANAAKGLVAVANQIPDDGTFGTDGIDDFGKNIYSFAKSLKKYSDKIAEVSISSITKSATAVRSLINVINSMVGMDSSGVDDFKKAVNDLARININGVVQNFTASASKLTNVGKNMFKSIISGAKSMQVEFVSAVRTIIATSMSEIAKYNGKFKASGARAIGEFLDGILSGRVKAPNAIVTVIVSALSTIGKYYGSFYAAGANLVTGFANGISANRYKAAAQAKAMASAAASAARKELDEHSPSRVGYGIGDFFGIGFVNAIGDNIKRAYNTSVKLANAAETGLKSAFDKVSRIISGEIDINPTISPVIDLTNVKAGANAISGMFGLQPSVGVLANVGAVSSMMNRRSQNGGSDDIVSAIGRLEKSLANAGGTTNNIINGVTYDDGSAVGEAVAVIARAILIEGRV